MSLNTYTKTRLSFVRRGLLISLATIAVVWILDCQECRLQSLVSVHTTQRQRPLFQDDLLEEDIHAILTNLQVSTRATVPDAFSGEISPLWTCSQVPTFPYSRKLIFVHIFKTAGSSFRAFLDDYARTCHRGISLVIHCSSVAAASMGDAQTPWESKNHKRCVNKFSRHRGDQVAWNTKGNVTGSLLRNTSDILVGHLPLGVHHHWKDANDHVVHPQYVAFFRDPIAKYVSGRLFVNRKKDWTAEEAVRILKQEVVTARQRGSYYLGCDKYLITPEQKELPLTLDERVQLVRTNLLSYRCLVGIVERMSSSLYLLQHVIDGDLEVTGQLHRLDTARPSQNDSNRTTFNQSKLSTDALVAELKRDPNFYPSLQEYLRYEFLIYDFALQIHARQVQALPNRHGSRSL
jgi:hypothetical protein